ncbi:MAG: hypothetical protein GWN87_06760 [Desulfuromonadales bacterium]|nr:hypothetical protein [Desulfuromonadales bacterium]
MKEKSNVLWALLSKPADAVRLMPSLVKSNCQASRNTTGKPSIRTRTTKVGSHSGMRSGSAAASMSCNTANTPIA